MARDRKRAKQRRNRRGAAATARGPGQAPAVPPSQPTRADLPGALDHASGEVDEFDAALVRGAGGVTASPETDLQDEAALEDQAGLLNEPGLRDGAPAATEDELEPLQAPPGGGAGGGAGGGGAGGDGRSEGGEHDRPAEAPLRLAQRAVAFLGASWAELQRVHWPDRRQVAQATAVVLGFVAIAGAYLGLADYVAKEIVEFVL